jgi:molybdopterin-guanine dinucleotide biosynthesis protein A
MPPTAFSAVVLAAGRSTRMGRDKALLMADGQPLWQRQHEVLAQAGAAEIFLSARLDQSWATEAKGFSAIVHDGVLRGGPLAGLAAALERASHPHLAVLAVDLPRMEAAWFHALLVECETGAGAVGRRENFHEPLAAIYPRELLPLVHDALRPRELSLQKLIATGVARGLLRSRKIAATEIGIFENWNEPGSL